MRPRLLAIAALLLVLLDPAALVAAAPPANTTVEGARLRALMRARRQLVERLAARDGQRGQLLTLTALATADAVLSADAAALQRDIVRLSWRPVRYVTPSHRGYRRGRSRVQWDRGVAGRRPRSVRSSTLSALIVAPGILRSPLARTVAPDLSRWSVQSAAGRVGPRTWGRRPLVGSLATLTSWATLLADGAGGGDGSVSRFPTRPALGASMRPVSVSVEDAPYDAPSYGRLALDGVLGPLPLAAANPLVSAAMRAPLSAPPTPVERRGQRRHRRIGRLTPGRLPERRALLAAATLRALEERRDAVLRALARVHVAEAWARTTAPMPVITANDVVTSAMVLRRRLDRWTTRPIITAADQTPTASLESGVRAPTVATGATVMLLSPAAGAVSPTITATVDVSNTLVSTRAGAVVGGRIVDGAPSGPTRIDAPIALAPLLPVTATSGATATMALSATILDMQATATTVLTTVATTAAVPSPSPSDPTSVAGTPTSFPAASALAAAGTAISATVPPTASTPLSATVPVSAGIALALSAESGTPVMTMTTAITPSAPLTLVVTLPGAAAQAVAPPGFGSDRGALESVLRQGEALFLQLKSSEAAVEANYRARLNAIVQVNSALERNWYARFYAYDRYTRAYAAYLRRVVAFNAYAHRLHLARQAREEWQQRSAGWTQYARALATYRLALELRRHQIPIGPITGTAPLSSTAPAPSAPLPLKPIMPPFPGPEPPAFVELPPAWPGAAPLGVASPGPEPSGYPLPDPPPAVPPWDGDSPPVALLSYGGIAPGVGAAGREETTQAALLAGGALDTVQGYQDPIKGVITTYWGGSTIFQSFHPGLDIAAPLYTPIHAAAAGIVTWAGYAVPGQRHYSYGNCVIIKHNDRFSTLYAHMDDQSHPLAVRVGDIVQQGQIIGYEGLTGWTTGPHLHFEMRENNIQFNPLLLVPNPQD